LTLMGQASILRVLRIIEAERFVLRRPDGKVRTTLATRPDGSPQPKRVQSLRLESAPTIAIPERVLT